MRYPISKYCLELFIDGQVGPQLVPKFSLPVSVRKIHNSMVSPPEEGVLKEERYAEDNIIIGDLTIRNILPPKLKKMPDQYKMMGGCECCISSKSIHLYLLTWHYRYLNHLKDKSHNPQNIRSGEL